MYASSREFKVTKTHSNPQHQRATKLRLNLLDVRKASMRRHAILESTKLNSHAERLPRGSELWRGEGDAS